MSKRTERGREVQDWGEVDVTPVMSILVILIPVLIFAFNFFEVSIQQVAAPKVGTPKEAKEDKKKQLQLTVVINEKGFTIKQNADLVTEKEKPIPKRSVSADDGAGEYDFPRLYTQLRKIKTAWPEEKTVNITGNPKIPWHVVARTIDASRLKLTEAKYDSMKSYAAAEVLVDKKTGEPQVMFDQVVFAVTD